MNSVCIATYNGERYLRGQLESILKQLSRDDELIISDDNSKDSTLDIVRSFNDNRIRIVKGPAKGHPRYNFENALRHCKGDFVFLCDQDDLWMDNKVEVFSEHLNDNDLVVSDCSIIDDKGNERVASFQSLKSPKQLGFWRNLINNHYLGCCMAFRRELLDIILPFPGNIAQHDIWIGLCAEAFNKRIRFIPERLMGYRRYDQNFSHGTKGYSKIYKVSYRLYFVYTIYKRKLQLRGKLKK